MFFKSSMTVLLCFGLSGCGFPEDRVQATQYHVSAEAAITCVSEGIHAMQTGADAQQYIDINYLQIKISEAFDVGNFFMFANQRSIKIAFDDLAETLFAQGVQNEAIVIDTIKPSHIEHAYILSGRLGERMVEVDVRFYGTDDCRILDIRRDGFSVTALFIGRLGSEPAFAKQAETDPLAELYE
jgi:hypothetical protein